MSGGKWWQVVAFGASIEKFGKFDKMSSLVMFCYSCTLCLAFTAHHKENIYIICRYITYLKISTVLVISAIYLSSENQSTLPNKMSEM